MRTSPAAARRIAQILAAGVFVNSLAMVPVISLYGVGRADVVAKLPLLELPLYLYCTVAAGARSGRRGAALAWTLRLWSMRCFSLPSRRDIRAPCSLHTRCDGYRRRCRGSRTRRSAAISGGPAALASHTGNFCDLRMDPCSPHGGAWCSRGCSAFGREKAGSSRGAKGSGARGRVM